MCVGNHEHHIGDPTQLALAAESRQPLRQRLIRERTVTRFHKGWLAASIRHLDNFQSWGG